MTSQSRPAGAAGWIELTGVRTHNLDGIDVRVPHHTITAFTGVSGSGKSSLVMDTLHAEAQLRYVEGFDPYVRKFLTPRDRPQIDRVRGLTATLAVDQRNSNRNPNSTLGTLTGVDAYLGLAFARLAPLATGSTWTGPLHPAQFDPYTRDGICHTCIGAREVVNARPDLIVPAPGLPLLEGGSPWFGGKLSNEATYLPSLAAHHGTDLSLPWNEQPEAFQHAALHGTAGATIEVTLTGSNKKKNSQYSYKADQALIGAIAEIEAAYAAAATDEAKEIYRPFLERQPCPGCEGTGLGQIARTVTLRDKTFRDVLESAVEDVRRWIDEVDAELNEPQRKVGQILVPELRDRLDLLIRLGLGHVELWRGAPTLSGGELQRARLSAQISTALSGLTYVFDEPGAGLHPADKDHLFAILCELREAGNTVLMVEHDPDLVARADWVIDLGPGGGRDGGTLMAAGTPGDIAAHPASVTGRYLREPHYRLERAERPPAEDTEWLVLHNAAVHNVSAPEVRIPLNRLTCLTGISGSGKSSLLNQVLANSVESALAGRPHTAVEKVSGLGGLRWVTIVDQSPIGRTPRSNPATYTKAFDQIRVLFAGTEEARRRGLANPSVFSFNSTGGRCETCQGLGQIKLDMQFLGDTYITCQACDGRRYTEEVLAVTYRGLAIDEVLNLTVSEAAGVFDEPETLAALLEAMDHIGLGYLTLGESGTALSGGEAQRIKLAKATLRGRRGNDPGLLILDEPVTGLHPDDAQRLMRTLDRLLERGQTVVIAEHDIHSAACADWIIDMGPGAGRAGGQIINAGTPAHVASGGGPTAPFLRRLVHQG
ncbi:ATP-binding cassette domain-containing protein [Crossiella sp. CA-258035]|uniref:ATP-binding cassette domain-containing protein n=1 Tax=Crossiella sp. CA-258035 TaxID=2981138 RepID=UPI0024BD0EE9|nr:ATP-binding cassette domain-containing protein [Crossiella sp. CA-258035]WHT23342.1 ATP-binding cassette domain-containing protein [Crossiella sp. CA-258035]